MQPQGIQSQDCDRLPQSTRIEPVSPDEPTIAIYRADTHVEGMALKLGFQSDYIDAGTWLSLSQARQLAAALTAHADAFEAQFPAEVAA